MKTQKYIIRSLKYLVQLLVLLAAVFLLMELTGTARAPFAEMLFSLRGVLLCVAAVLLAAAYPAFGYVKRAVAGNLTENLRQVEEAFEMGNYQLESEEHGKLIFRAKNPLRRVVMLGEDPVAVTGADGQIILEGHRKQVAMAEFRLKSLIRA